MNYFTTLLNNPAISGLAAQIPWHLLNPNSPGPNPASPLPGAFAWNALDDVFTAVDNWNKSHSSAPPKTILDSSGFGTPNWVFNDIDVSVCDKSNGCGSCDGLFASPVSKPSQQCGYTTIFYGTEGGAVSGTPRTPSQTQLPVPWNSVYKPDHATYLTALNQRIQQEPSSGTFVTISISGPTASSDEMILPSLENQNLGGNKGIIVLNGVTTNPPFTAATAWNALINDYYTPAAGHADTDIPFIMEWENAIDLYGSIFSGVTLNLTTTTDALPDSDAAAPAQLVPAPGFTSDCGITNVMTPPGNWQNNQEQCAAVTQILSYYVNPKVGGNNAKAISESGVTASRDSDDLGTNGIRWLAANTAAGGTPLPGTPYNMSRILGGLQFSHEFSAPLTVQSEGCTTNPTTANPTPCGADFTPAEGLQNVLQYSYFVGTPAAPVFGASASVNQGKFAYKNAPMNYVQIYDVDILYASGLSNCSILQFAGSPANNIEPDVSTCTLVAPFGGTSSVQSAQSILETAAQQMLAVAELPVPAIMSGGILPETIQPGEWVSIFGTGLAFGTATWNGDFPVMLAGTSVTIDGKAAYLSYVSPGQINLQAPSGGSTGSVPLVVTTPAGTATSNVTLAQLSPEFFLLDGKHVAGIILRSNGKGAYGGGTYDILGPTGTSLGYATVAAKAGDSAVLFGTGFGPTNPSVATGQTYTGAAPTTNLIALRINNASIAPTFAGLSGAGLYQFNVTVPSGLGTGDVPLQATVGGVQTPSGVVISLQ